MSLRKGLARIQVVPGRSVDLHAVPEAVRNAGFTPGRMTLRAIGSFQRIGEEIWFRVRGGDLRLRVLSPHRHPQVQQAGQSVEIEGIVSESAGHLQVQITSLKLRGSRDAKPDSG